MALGCPNVTTHGGCGTEGLAATRMGGVGSGHLSVTLWGYRGLWAWDAMQLVARALL